LISLIFNNGIEGDNFKGFKIVDFKGTASPSNKSASVKDCRGDIIASICKQNVDGFEKIK